jgi:prepilin-type N-terminal cleavage/methylation domain-containing protein
LSSLWTHRASIAQGLHPENLVWWEGTPASTQDPHAMPSPSVSSRRTRGFTVLELVITLALLSIFLFGILATVTGLQSTFVENEVVADMHLRAERAMDRIVEMAGGALTNDPQFAPLKPTSGVDSHCLRFSFITSVDSVTATPVYSSNLVYIYGPDTGANPSRGLIIGRGPSLDAIWSQARGADGFLGTTDDDTSTLVSGDPYVELLIPSNYAPQTGDMFQVDVSGRLLTVTLRLNAVGRAGTFILPNDLVMTERVALRQ